MRFLISFLAIVLMGVLTFAQETITISANSEDISQSLDLRVVAKLFAEANTTEQFENILNNPDSAFSNLDLNGDNQIDYLRLVEASTADNKLIIIQAVLAKDIYQDVASIYVEKDVKTQEVSVQIIGDEYIYGTNYIIEPVYVYRPVIYNWFWSPRWYCWESPWYWGYWPNWWYYRPCYTYHWYYNRCYRFHHYHHHYCSFRHGHHLHHNYHAIHNTVSRREYAVSHPDNSFNRRHTDVRNAGEFHRTGVSRRNGGTKQPNFGNSSRTFDNRNTSIHRSESAVSTRSASTQQTSAQRSASQSWTSRTTQSRSSNNSNRPTFSTQQSRRTLNVNRINTPTTQSSYRISNSFSRPSSSYGSSRTNGGSLNSSERVSNGSRGSSSLRSSGHSVRR